MVCHSHPLGWPPLQLSLLVLHHVKVNVQLAFLVDSYMNRLNRHLVLLSLLNSIALLLLVRSPKQSRVSENVFWGRKLVVIEDLR